MWEKKKVGGGEERCGERKGGGDRGKWKVEEKWEENKEEDEQENEVEERWPHIFPIPFNLQLPLSTFLLSSSPFY